ERADRFLFSKPVFTVPASIFVSASSEDIQGLSDLAGRRVAVPETDFAEEFLRKKKISCRFVMTADFKEAVNALVAGDVDAIVGDEQTVYYYLFKYNLGDRIQRTGDVLYEGKCCFAARKDNPVLISILNKGLAAAEDDGVVARIERQWLGLENTAVGVQIVRYSRYIVSGVAVLFVAVLLFWVWDVYLVHRIKEKNRQLYNSEERLRTIFQNSPDAIFIESEDGIVLDANPAACSFHGLSYHELIGTNVFDLVPGDQRENVKNNFPKWFSGELRRYEGMSMAADGRDVPVEVIGTPLRYEGQTAVLLLVRDMTDREQAEQALRKSEMRYRGLIEVQSSLIARIDTGGRFTFVNEALCRFLGRTRAELIG
ncbi:MAG TPA: PAS domain S-box protein, partial [Tichowtungia sp.]|nr:PAS domain S-box protein [Tichowtungia sp.]